MRILVAYFVIGLLLLSALPTRGVAQDVVARTGQVARLHLLDRKITGQIVSIRFDSVFLRRTMEGRISPVARSDIQRIDVKFSGANRRQRTIAGAAIGAFAGAVGGVYLSTHVPCADCVVTRKDQVLGTLAIAGIFSALGGLFGFIATPPRWAPATFPN